MYCLFHKHFEDENIVSYWVSTDYWDESYLPEVKWIPIKGFCIFDKNAKTASFEPDKTDSQFFELKTALLMIKGHLADIDKRQKGFPQSYSIATG